MRKKLLMMMVCVVMLTLFFGYTTVPADTANITDNDETEIAQQAKEQENKYLKEKLEQQFGQTTNKDENNQIKPKYIPPETFYDGEVDFSSFRVIIPDSWYAMNPTENSVTFSSDKFEQPWAMVTISIQDKKDNQDAYTFAESINAEYDNVGEIVQVEYNDIVYYKLSVTDTQSYLTADIDESTCIEISIMMTEFESVEELLDNIVQ